MHAPPRYSEPGGPDCVVENIHLVKLSEKGRLHQNSASDRSFGSDRQSPPSFGKFLGDQRVSNISEQANVNIIVHNEFEKPCPSNKPEDLITVSMDKSN